MLTSDDLEIGEIYVITKYSFSGIESIRTLFLLEKAYLKTKDIIYCSFLEGKDIIVLQYFANEKLPCYHHIDEFNNRSLVC